MFASWQLNLQTAQVQPGCLTVTSVRHARDQFGSQFGEILASVTDGKTSWEVLGSSSLQQNDTVSIVCGIAKKP